MSGLGGLSMACWIEAKQHDQKRQDAHHRCCAGWYWRNNVSSGERAPCRCPRHKAEPRNGAALRQKDNPSRVQ